MADNVQFVELGFEANTASINKTKKETTGLIAPIASVEKAIDKLNKAEKDETKTVKALATQLGKLSDEGKQNVKVANERLQVLRKQEAAIKDVEQAERDLISVLEEETRKQKAASQVAPRKAGGRSATTEAAGSTAGGLGAISTLAGTVGLTGIQDVATLIDDSLTALEKAPEFLEGFKGFKDIFSQATTASTGAAAATTALTAAETAEGVAAGAATPATAGLAVGIGAMTLAAAPFLVAGAAIAALFAALAIAITKANEAAEIAVAAQFEYFEIIETGTTESTNAALKDLEIKKTIAEKQIAFAEAQLEAMSGLEELFSREDEALAEGLKESRKQLSETTAAIDVHTKALGSEEVAANDAAASQKSANAEQSRSTPVTQKSTEATKANTVAQKESISVEEERIEVTKKQISLSKEFGKVNKASFAIFGGSVKESSEGIAEAAEKEAEIAKGRSEDIEEAASDLDSALLKLDREFDDETEKRVREHEDAKKKIRKESQRGETDLIRRRDFAGLRQLKETTQDRISEENTRFGQEERERKIDRVNRIRELRIDHRQRLAEIRSASAEALRALHEGLAEELRLKQQALRQGNSLLVSALGGIKIVGRQGGGPLSAGQAARVNEDRFAPRESFVSGLNPVELPGAGLFMPDRPGRVERGNKGAGNISMQFNVTGSNRDEILREIDKKYKQGRRDLESVLGSLA